MVVKAQTSFKLYSVSLVPSLLTYTEYRSIYRRRYRLKLEIGPLAPLWGWGWGVVGDADDMGGKAYSRNPNKLRVAA